MINNDAKMNAAEYQHEAQRLRPLLKAEAQRYLQNADEAEDMVQDVLLKLWLIRQEVALPMDALAKVLVRNRCIDRLRRLRPTTDIDNLPLIEPTDDTQERIDRMMTIIRQLPDMQQTVLRLRHIDGMDMADIARLTGSSEVAIRKTLSRARLAVRDIYLKKE
jgi:RNA polymerase sigma-70 factor (ECF subfamily)